MAPRGIGAAAGLGLSAGAVAWSGWAAPRIPSGWRVAMQTAVGAAALGVTRAPTGLRPPLVWRGGRLGLAAAAAVTVGVAASSLHPRVRRGMGERDLPRPASGWLLVRIPLGTVWAEEALYRGAVGAAATTAFGPRLGRLVQAAAFGLSHVGDARSAGEPVVGTVLVTGVAGWVFGWLHEKSGSLAAPMLAHLASNEAGAIAALLVQRTPR